MDPKGATLVRPLPRQPMAQSHVPGNARIWAAVTTALQSVAEGESFSTRVMPLALGY